MAPAAVVPKDPPPVPSTTVAISPVSPVIVRVKRPCMLPISSRPDVPGSLVPRDPSLPARPYMRQVVPLRLPFGEGPAGPTLRMMSS